MVMFAIQSTNDRQSSNDNEINFEIEICILAASFMTY